jgi:hypothetical protein
LKADVRRDLDASRDDFHRLVWPVVGPLIGGGEIVSVESKELKVALGQCAPGIVREAASALARMDELCGIDAYQVVRQGMAVRGVASRVQCDGISWETFTLRLRRESGNTTEWEKRELAVTRPDLGYLFPHLTVQAYVDRTHEKLLSVAVVRTVDLVNFTARFGPFECRKQKRRMDRPYVDRTHDGTYFIVVPWCALMAGNVRLLIPDISEAA